MTNPAPKPQKPTTKPAGESIGYLLLLITGTLWGTSGIWIKGMESYGADAAVTVILRLAPTFVIMLLATMFVHGPASLKVSPKTLLSCGLSGLVSQALFNICYINAIRIDGAAMAAILLYLAPSITMVTSKVLFHEPMTGQKLAALPINLVGCILAVTGGDFTQINAPLYGLLFGVGASVCFSLSPIFNRLAMGEAPPMVANTWLFFFASVAAALMLGPSADFSAIHLTGPFWFYAAGSVVLNTVLAYVCYLMGINKVTETGRVPIFTSVEPVVATLIGAFVFHEGIGPIKWIGVALVICSIIMMNLGKADARRAKN